MLVSFRRNGKVGGLGFDNGQELEKVEYRGIQLRFYYSSSLVGVVLNIIYRFIRSIILGYGMFLLVERILNYGCCCVLFILDVEFFVGLFSLLILSFLCLYLVVIGQKQ